MLDVNDASNILLRHFHRQTPKRKASNVRMSAVIAPLRADWILDTTGRAGSLAEPYGDGWTASHHSLSLQLPVSAIPT